MGKVEKYEWSYAGVNEFLADSMPYLEKGATYANKYLVEVPTNLLGEGFEAVGNGFLKLADLLKTDEAAVTSFVSFIVASFSNMVHVIINMI